jgi:hypothetical protein
MGAGGMFRGFGQSLQVFLVEGFRGLLLGTSFSNVD